MCDFIGKNILILGGSRVLRRDCPPVRKGGGKIAFTYAGSKDAAEALAGETRAEAIRTDSADRDALIATVASRGALDVLVANAGTLVMGDPLTLEADAIDHMIDVNVRAPYHAAVEAARKMPDNGRIIVSARSTATLCLFRAEPRMRSPNRRCRAWSVGSRAISAIAELPSTASSLGRLTAT